MSLFVVDMSNFQGVPDMIRARDEGGVQAAVLKLTEGTYYLNELFDAQAAACDRARIPYAVYGYNGNKYNGVDYRVSGKIEASFLLTVGGAARWRGRPIWLDLEDNTGTQPQPDYGLAWGATIGAGGGQFAGIYSYKNFIENYLQDARLAAYNLWYANYPNEIPAPTDAWPPAPPPWSSYRGWQFSGGMQVPGIGNVDGSYFAGTVEDFMSMGNAEAPAPPAPDLGSVRAYIDANGHSHIDIDFGGQAVDVEGFVVVDAGVTSRNAAGIIYDRTCRQPEGFLPWEKRDATATAHAVAVPKAVE